MAIIKYLDRDDVKTYLDSCFLFVLLYLIGEQLGMGLYGPRRGKDEGFQSLLLVCFTLLDIRTFVDGPKQTQEGKGRRNFR